MYHLLIRCTGSLVHWSQYVNLSRLSDFLMFLISFVPHVAKTQLKSSVSDAQQSLGKHQINEEGRKV